MRRQFRSSHYGYWSAQRRRFSPLVFAGILVPVVLVLIAGAVFILPHMGSHAAAAVNGDCTLIVPANPLSAKGLATPYQLVATNQDNGPCNETNKAQAAFVQGAVFDPATNKISVYDPLVIDKGTDPALAPVVPTIPQGAVVALWFGFNGTNLILKSQGDSLLAGNCVNGLNDSIFGQFSYCNAPAFFQAANAAIQAGKLVVPPLGTGNDKLPCPTVRDFGVVDQDQSDNVTTEYLINANGQLAQNTTTNAAALKTTLAQVNGSDNRLLAVALDGALGCAPWTVPDLANPGSMTTALPLNELQAAAFQAAPVAYVPLGDPMVLVNNKNNLDKLNTYRSGVNQPTAQAKDVASTRAYCTNLLAIAPQRMLLDAPFTRAGASPDPALATNLFTFLAQRFVTTYEANGLNCMKLLHHPDPVKVQTNEGGVAVEATINGSGSTGNAPIDCSVNGTILGGCTGTATINGQACTFTLEKNARQVTITCPAAAQ